MEFTSKGASMIPAAAPTFAERLGPQAAAAVEEKPGHGLGLLDRDAAPYLARRSVLETTAVLRRGVRVPPSGGLPIRVHFGATGQPFGLLKSDRNPVDESGIWNHFLLAGEGSRGGC